MDSLQASKSGGPFTPTSALERAQAMLSQAGGRFAALPARSRFSLLGAAAGVLVLCAVLASLALKPSWRVLYAGLDPQDARELGAELTAANISFDVSPDGTVLKVPANVLDKARLETATRGGPRSGRMGFELFDKPNWVGSEFDEKVNYQRALEGELEHTIASIGSIQTARVHLVLPHDSLFSDQQREAKASVVLKLRRHSLSPTEADAIRNLVASAVDKLSPNDVVLVDADGRVALGAKTADAAQSDHEQLLSDRLVATLEPLVGAGNVHASVNVDYDTSTADEVDETYDPNGTVTLAMQRSEQQTGDKQAVAGVPGTASNAPNVQPPLFPASKSDAMSAKQESGTYGVSKRTRHLVESPGRLKRITAAVLINDRVATEMVGHKGSVTHAAWSPDEMKRIMELAQAAIGYQASRGDVVSVENISFGTNDDAQPSTADRVMRVAAAADVWKYATVLVALFALIFLVIRPAAKNLTAVSALPLVTSVESTGQNFRAVDEPSGEEDSVLPFPRMHRQPVLQQVASIVDQDTEQSARLLRSWLNNV
jgi:flagellar M-ring protein FliF